MLGTGDGGTREDRARYPQRERDVFGVLTDHRVAGEGGNREVRALWERGCLPLRFTRLSGAIDG